jgi:zinc D-Ala-D-Ala carboxypeptidase
MSIVRDWSKYKNFTKEEFDCKHTGKNMMQEELLYKLQKLRDLYGKPLTITSGYRDITHPIEAKKDKGGYHTKGMACDVSCGSQQAFDIMNIALKAGFNGIGVKQKGDGRFLHLDIREYEDRVIYSY